MSDHSKVSGTGGVTLARRADRPGEAERAEEILHGASAARVWSQDRPCERTGA